MSGAARIALAAALLAAATGARAQSLEALAASVPSITVTGEAKRDVAPDLALVTLGVTTDRATAAQAAGDNAQAAATLVASAHAAGLGNADIQTSELRLSAIPDAKDASKIKAYQASNQVTLRMHDLGKVGILVGQLTAQGANSIGGVDFTLADPRPILDDLQAEATRDAARKAGIYAAAAGVKLGRILHIAPLTDGPMPMARAFKLQAEAAPVPPVEAGTQQLQSRVQITWELTP